MKIVPLTQDIAERFFDGPPPVTARGYAALRGAEPLCIGGVYHSNGNPVAFANVKPEMRKYPVAGMKLARKVVEMVRGMGVTVYVMADCNVESARRFIERLGFKHLTGEVYAWPR
jgi:hypothetical protein